VCLFACSFFVLCLICQQATKSSEAESFKHMKINTLHT
jgi:hypothetical protein